MTRIGFETKRAIKKAWNARNRKGNKGGLGSTEKGKCCSCAWLEEIIELKERH